MKKRIVPLLLTVALLVTASVFAVDADPVNPFDNQTGTVSAYCEHCKDTVNWAPVPTALTDASTMNAGGHYYLTGATTMSGVQFNPATGKTLCLELNNKTFYRNGQPIGLTAGGTVNIFDRPDGTGALVGNVNTSTSGGVAVITKGTVNLYSGTLKVSKAPTGAAIAKQGGIVFVNSAANVYSDSIFNMYGGKIEGIYTSSSGGAINVYEGIFNATGGEVSGGTTDSMGGNIYLAAQAQGSISGLKVTGGTSKVDNSDHRGGGNLCVYGGTVTLGAGNVFSNGTAVRGGNLDVAGNGTMIINGGSYSNGTASNRGGNICAGAGTTLTISDGTIIDGVLASGSSQLGGNIYAQGNVTMTGGTVSGGKTLASAVAGNTATYGAGRGGNINVRGTGKFTMSGGTIVGGIAANGGNLSLEGSGAHRITGGTVTGGYASSGGNLYNMGNVTITNGNITDGTASLGGCLFNTTTLTISGGTVSGGTVTGRGGNLFQSATTATTTITGGTITEGFSKLAGGNVYINNGVFTMTGGILSNGQGSEGGNLYTKTNEGAVIRDDGNAETPVPQITGGKATVANGGNICNLASMTLGNSTISGGYAQDFGNNIFADRPGVVTILQEFAGDTTIQVFTGFLPDAIYGGQVSSNMLAEGPFPGKLVLEGNYHEACLYAEEGSTALYVTGAALVDNQGVITWYKDNAAAMAAYTDTVRYIRAGAGQLVLQGGNYIVDLAGQAVNVTGTGNVTFLDSANSNFKAYGTVTVSGPVVTNSFKTTVVDADYYMIQQDGVYSFHRLGMRICGVSIRPSDAGIYYRGIWECDDLLKAQITAFGVAVSTADMPNGTFNTTDTDTRYTQFSQASFVSGQQMTGVLINDILKTTAADNANRANTDIYAAAYVTFQDGTVSVTEENISCNLHEAAQIISSNIYRYATFAQTMTDFRTFWGNYGITWDFSYEVSQDIIHLNALYNQMDAYHGELHDHANTGGTSDGKVNLQGWLDGMDQLGMDFATIVDHRQVLHMTLEDWDNSRFIGGSEASTVITDSNADDDEAKLHYNMIFADPAGLEAVLNAFPEFSYRNGHFVYPNFTTARFQELIACVKANGGFFSLVHPKSAGYIDSTNPLDYWFADGTGLEVIYTIGDTRDGAETAANYKLWTDLLAAGKRVWATAGNDAHKMPTTKALSTIYAASQDASAFVEQLRSGNFAAGSMGIRMAIGDTAMGGSTNFAGQRLVFSVGDFHETVADPTHTYRVDLIADSDVVYSQTISCEETFYYALDADATRNFYRVEVWDTTLNSRIGIGNPIWNDQVLAENSAASVQDNTPVTDTGVDFDAFGYGIGDAVIPSDEDIYIAF